MLLADIAEIPMNDPIAIGDMIDLPDGGVEVILSEELGAADSMFGENLVFLLDDPDDVAGEFVDLIAKDKEARKKRDEQYEEGLRRTGLGDDAPGGAQFSGASRVVHPMLAEACVDFEARAIKELFPAGGPVRTSLYSEAADDRVQAAELKRDILNLQFTRTIPEYRDELESLLSQLPMGGSQYMKLWWDGRRKRVEFVPIDHVYLPFSATNFYTALRATHAQTITKFEFDQRVKSGLYRDIDDMSEPTANDISKSEKANNKIEGRDDDEAYNEDGLRTVYEIYTWYSFSEDGVTGGDPAPYILHIDVYTEKLLGAYRNWEEDDTTFTKLDWFAEFGFIPWRGAYKIGLPHLIGGLSGAATGALRALLDSAHAANAPTLLKLKAGRMVGQTTEIAITQVQEIEGPSGIDDIRKLVSPIPFAGPNPVLLQLLGILIDAGKGVVSTAEEKIADVSDRMPVGTSLAMIEQGSKVFSAIHSRLHASQSKVMEILCRLNARYPELEEWQELLGKNVDPTIFDRTDDIVPVSDPNIFSEAQRFAQMQAVMQLIADPTVQYNRVEAHTRMLKLLNVPQPELLLPSPPKAQRLDAVQENMVAVSNTPLKAYPDQDHLAHIEVHLRFILNPALGGGPAYVGQQLAPLLAHCSEHWTMYYPQMVESGKMMALSEGHLAPGSAPDAANAVGANKADGQIQQYQAIMEMWTAAQQTVQKKTPPPPMDPQVQATMQIAQMEDAREKAKMQGEAMKQAAEMEMKQAAMQHDQKIDMMKLEQSGQMDMMQKTFDQKAEQLTAQVELMKNEQDNKQHQMTELLKNHEDNQTALVVERMRQQVNMLAQSQDKIDPVLETMQSILGSMMVPK